MDGLAVGRELYPEGWAELPDPPEFRRFLDLKVERSADVGHDFDSAHRFRFVLLWPTIPLSSSCPELLLWSVRLQIRTGVS